MSHVRHTPSGTSDMYWYNNRYYYLNAAKYYQIPRLKRLLICLSPFSNYEASMDISRDRTQLLCGVERENRLVSIRREAPNE
jgi:hypothetical protein